MNPELIEFYTELLQERGCEVQQDGEEMIDFEFERQKFFLIAYSDSSYHIMHSVTMPNGIGAQDNPRILDAVNLSNIFHPNVAATVVGRGDNVGVSITAKDKTEPTLGLYMLKSNIDDLLEASRELFTNISNPDFAYVLKK